MVCVWFIYRKMELRYWLLPGKVKDNRSNKLVERKAFVNTVRIKSADFENKFSFWSFALEFCGKPQNSRTKIYFSNRHT